MQNKFLIDERRSSWKVLLPVSPDSKVLALGLDEDVLSGLFRSFRTVDTQPVLGKMYDAVVLDCLSIPSSPFLKFRSCIDGKTIILCLHPDPTITDHLTSYGYSYFSQYAGLPAGTPRIYFPLATRRLRAKGLSFHRPGSRKAKIALLAAKSLSGLGIKRHLMGNSMRIFSSCEDMFFAGSLASWVSKKIGYKISDLVVYAGSESERRKITGLAVAETCGKDVVVKIADSPGGAEAITQESAALKALASTPLAVQVPELLFEGEWNGYAVQGQSAFSAGSSLQDACLSDAHFMFLAELASIDRKFLPFRQTRVFNVLDRSLKTISPDFLPPVVANVWSDFSKKNSDDWKVLCHRTHGDFAPWNIRKQQGKLFVYDWEDSLEEGVAVTDGLHFVFRQADLVGPWPGSERMVEKFRRVCIRYFADIGCVEKEHYPKYILVWLLKEYAENRSIRIAEMIEHLAEGMR